MNRLTMTSEKGGVAFTFDLDITCKPSEAQKILKLANKLKHYEDLEEQGLLLRLPCKVGDTVYQVNHLRKCVSSFKVKTVSVTAFGFWVEWELLEGMYINLNGFNGEEIGKTVFLTKDAAEQELAEMKEV